MSPLQLVLIYLLLLLTLDLWTKCALLPPMQSLLSELKELKYLNGIVFKTISLYADN